MDMITIREVTENDLQHIQKLWADGDVMKFVGFPEGLRQTDEQMERWLKRIEAARPNTNAYAIYDGDIYCGETFYQIDSEYGNSAALDIKLFAFARGKGIATQALSYAIDEAFRNGAAKVWVDPNPENHKAIALYDRLGFERKSMPEYLLEDDEEATSVYMERIR